MKRCWKKRIFATMFLIIISLIYVFLLLWILTFLIKYFVEIGVCSIFAIALIAIFGLSVTECTLDVLQKNQKYAVNENGICIESLLRKRRTYRWDEVGEISVCDVYHAREQSIYHFVIRIVIGEEPEGPRNPNCKRNLFGYEKWRKAGYGRYRMNRILLIEYSEEKYIEIAKMSNMEIRDYRRKYSDANKVILPKVHD